MLHPSCLLLRHTFPGLYDYSIKRKHYTTMSRQFLHLFDGYLASNRIGKIMAVKTNISKNELIQLLSDYELGEYQDSKPFRKGTVQTTLFLQTTRGKFVLKYYENRTPESV